MFLLKEKISTQIEVKKSKFIAILAPFKDFESLNKALRDEHPKAAHVVWAYRYLNEFGQIVENSSDDGEPKGSSAPALLAALRGAELIDTCALVVRYFGGIKLGIGGLVRAYGTSVNEAIKSAKDMGILEFFEKKESLKVFVPFALISRCEHFAKTQNINFSQEFSAAGCDFSFNINQSQKAELIKFCATLNIIVA
ncbi:YigZ family protein [Campylobacter magnus]|uniref:YigZ family protein n=1 Tax=Campylobacter magnus TaxID=3026462 RepID=UPI0026DECD03|nr:YigZ family protein [Campylobacter magnus]MDO2407939.1 YigZ family protein [Campylobacter magnus]